MDVPPQDVISRDNVSVNVNAVVYFRVVDAANAMLQVERYYEAISQVAQTTMRSVLGQRELDEMLTERDKLSADIQKILDDATNPWGVKITNVELKHVDLQESMIRAMARQAEAERSRRAKVIHAEGEMQASEKLREAAAMLSQDPDRHRRRQELHHRLSAAHGPDHAVSQDHSGGQCSRPARRWAGPAAAAALGPGGLEDVLDAHLRRHGAPRPRAERAP